MPDLDIAVVIVTYKSAQLTIDSLRAVAAERATPGLSIRAIVVDNDSGDLQAIAPAVAENNWSPWVSLVAAPKNGGFAYGNNLGIRQAYAHSPPDYVYLLNPDAFVRPGAIGTLVDFLQTHPDVGIAGSSFEDFDGSDWPFAFRFPGLLSELSQGIGFGPVSKVLRRWEVPQRMTKTRQPIDWICGASMLIRPAVLATIGGLDENYFLYFEETDFCLRARRAGFATWYVPESRVMHIRGGSTQVSSSETVPKRLPAYWFESRRRYFATSHGIPYAIVIDLVALLANIAGTLKRTLLGRTRTATPHLISDLVHHSLIWPRNRALPPVSCFIPSQSTKGQL